MTDQQMRNKMRKFFLKMLKTNKRVFVISGYIKVFGNVQSVKPDSVIIRTETGKIKFIFDQIEITGEPNVYYHSGVKFKVC